VAHYAQPIPARLSIYPVGRQQSGRVANLCQPRHYLCPGRAMAWPNVVVCSMGGDARGGDGGSPAMADPGPKVECYRWVATDILLYQCHLGRVSRQGHARCNQGIHGDAGHEWPNITQPHDGNIRIFKGRGRWIRPVVGGHKREWLVAPGHFIRLDYGSDPEELNRNVADGRLVEALGLWLGHYDRADGLAVRVVYVFDKLQRIYLFQFLNA